MRMKKFVAIFLCAVLLFALTACAPKGEAAHYEVKHDARLDTFYRGLEFHNIRAATAPRWIPDGYEMTQFELAQYGEANSVYANFQNGEKYFHINVTQTPSGVAHKLEYMPDSRVEYVLNGITHYVYSGEFDVWSAVWEADGFVAEIYGVITEEEIYKMIDSVYGVEIK